MAGRVPKMPPAGAATSVWCATSAALGGMGGVYCEDVDIAESVQADSTALSGARPWILDVDLAERLWKKSEDWTGARLDDARSVLSIEPNRTRTHEDGTITEAPRPTPLPTSPPPSASATWTSSASASAPCVCPVPTCGESPTTRRARAKSSAARRVARHEPHRLGLVLRPPRLEPPHRRDAPSVSQEPGHRLEARGPATARQRAGRRSVAPEELREGVRGPDLARAAGARCSSVVPPSGTWASGRPCRSSKVSFGSADRAPEGGQDPAPRPLQRRPQGGARGGPQAHADRLRAEDMYSVSGGEEAPSPARPTPEVESPEKVLELCEKHGIAFMPLPSRSPPARTRSRRPPSQPPPPSGRHVTPAQIAPGVAPGSFARDAPHPRHESARAPRGELGGAFDPPSLRRR